MEACLRILRQPTMLKNERTPKQTLRLEIGPMVIILVLDQLDIFIPSTGGHLNHLPDDEIGSHLKGE